MLKKLCSYLLALLTLILSLSTATGCVFDPTVNVKRDGFNAYIYNGERYIRTPEMDNYYPFLGSNRTERGVFIGYGLRAIGIKDPVYVCDWDEECNVIIFCGYFNNRFYVKESIQLPSFLEIECDFFVNGEKIIFQLKDVVSEKIDFDVLQKTKILEQIGFKGFYFLEHALRMNFYIYKDQAGNVYIDGSLTNNLGCYQIIDEEFKQQLVKACAE